MGDWLPDFLQRSPRFAEHAEGWHALLLWCQSVVMTFALHFREFRKVHALNPNGLFGPIPNFPKHWKLEYIGATTLLFERQLLYLVILSVGYLLTLLLWFGI